jgi:hypothetical protein
MTCYEWLIVTEGPFHRLFWYFGDHQSPPQSHFWSVVVGKHVFSLLNFGPWNMLNISKHGMCFFQMTIQYFWWLTHQTVEACNILIYFAPRARVVPLGIFGHLIWSERSMIIIDGVLFEANHSMGKPSNYMILYGYLWYIYIHIYILSMIYWRWSCSYTKPHSKPGQGLKTKRSKHRRDSACLSPLPHVEIMAWST